MAGEASEATIEYTLRRRAILVSVRSAILTGGVAAGAVIASIVGGPRSVVAAIFAGILAVALAVSTFMLRRKLAKRLAITDRGLDAWPLSGPMISMMWDEISTVSTHASPTVDGSFRHCRVIARDGRWIVFTDLTNEFDHLVTRIERAATSRYPIPQRLPRRQRLLLLS